jgi:hypothetical protein
MKYNVLWLFHYVKMCDVSPEEILVTSVDVCCDVRSGLQPPRQEAAAGASCRRNGTKFSLKPSGLLSHE